MVHKIIRCRLCIATGLAVQEGQQVQMLVSLQLEKKRTQGNRQGSIPGGKSFPLTSHNGRMDRQLVNDRKSFPLVGFSKTISRLHNLQMEESTSTEHQKLELGTLCECQSLPPV